MEEDRKIADEAEQQGTARPLSEPTAASEEKTTTPASEQGDPKPAENKAFTPKKGRPTPKRNEVEREQGVRREAYEAPTTPAEARKRKKELKASMSKQEYKAMKQRERDQAARERRRVNERMMAGDEKYLMDRDKSLSESSSATGSMRIVT